MLTSGPGCLRRCCKSTFLQTKHQRGGGVILWICPIQQIIFSPILDICNLLTHQATLTIWDLSSPFTALLIMLSQFKTEHNPSLHLELLDIYGVHIYIAGTWFYIIAIFSTHYYTTISIIYLSIFNQKG